MSTLNPLFSGGKVVVVSPQRAGFSVPSLQNCHVYIFSRLHLYCHLTTSSWDSFEAPLWTCCHSSGTISSAKGQSGKWVACSPAPKEAQTGKVAGWTRIEQVKDVPLILGAEIPWYPREPRSRHKVKIIYYVRGCFVLVRTKSCWLFSRKRINTHSVW